MRLIAMNCQFGTIMEHKREKKEGKKYCSIWNLACETKGITFVYI
jgi:hypothetical protein